MSLLPYPKHFQQLPSVRELENPVLNTQDDFNYELFLVGKSGIHSSLRSSQPGGLPLGKLYSFPGIEWLARYLIASNL